jgi:hypothetical protein
MADFTAEVEIISSGIEDALGAQGMGQGTGGGVKVLEV